MDWLIFALGALVLFTFLGYNRLIRLRTNVYKAFDLLDKHIEERNALMKDILSYMRKSMNNERSKPDELMELYYKDKNEDLTLSQRVKLNNEINRILAELMAVADEYPGIKNDNSFRRLKLSLSAIEEQLRKSATPYNEAVRFYNNTIYMFPSNVFALLFGFKVVPDFEIGEQME